MAKKTFNSTLVGLIENDKKKKGGHGGNHHGKGKTSLKDIKVKLATGKTDVKKLRKITDLDNVEDMKQSKFNDKMGEIWKDFNIEINNYFGGKGKSKIWSSEADIAETFCDPTFCKRILKFMKKESKYSNAVFSVYATLYMKSNDAIVKNEDVLRLVIESITEFRKEDFKIIKKIVSKAEAAALLLLSVATVRNRWTAFKAINEVLYTIEKIKAGKMKDLLDALLPRHEQVNYIRFLLQERSRDSENYEVLSKYIVKVLGSKKEDQLEDFFKHYAKPLQKKVKEGNDKYISVRFDLTDIDGKEGKKIKKVVKKFLKKGRYSEKIFVK